MISEISITTILLLLFLKVFPPWADTWSDGSLIIKLFKFGKDSSRGFNVTNMDFFVASTIDCHEFQIFNETDERERKFHKFHVFNQSEWIDVTMDYKILSKASVERNQHPTTTQRSTTESFNKLQPHQEEQPESSGNYDHNYDNNYDKTFSEYFSEYNYDYTSTTESYNNYAYHQNPTTTQRYYTSTTESYHNYDHNYNNLQSQQEVQPPPRKQNNRIILTQKPASNWCFFFCRRKRDATLPSIQDEQIKLFEIVKATITEQSRTLVQCKKDYSGWALAAMIPVMSSLVFTLVVWWTEEHGRTKLLLVPIVFLGLYSQYRAVKIILIGLGKWPKRECEEWLEEKGKFTREIVSIEPTTEALPMMLIQVALLTTEVPALFYSHRPSPLLEYPVFFPATFSITLLLTVLGLVHFLKDGPSPLISSEGYLDGFVSTKFAALFCSILLWFSAKCLVLMGVIYNYASYSTGDNITSIAGIQLGKHISSLMMLWMSTLVLPQLIHAIIVLAWSMRSNVFSLCLSFPSFLITPLFTPFTYKASSTDDGKYELQVSTKQSMINTFLTIVLTPLTMSLYYTDYIWNQTYNFGPISEQVNETSEEWTLKVTEFVQFKVLLTVILPIIFLLLSIIPTFYVLGYSVTRENGIQRTYVPRNTTKFEKIGKIRWETKKMEDFPRGSEFGNEVNIRANEVQEAIKRTYAMPDIDENNMEAKLDSLREDFAFDYWIALDYAMSAPSATLRGL